MAGLFAAIEALCSNITIAFHNTIANVQGWWYGLLSTVLTVVAGICEALNKLPFVEFDYSGIVSKADEFAAKSAAAVEGKKEYVNIADTFMDEYASIGAFSEGWASDAFQAGAAWGDGVADKVGGFFGGFGYEPGSMDDLMEKYGNIPSYLKDPLDGLGNDVGTIADNTGGMMDSLEISGEELKYLRDIAERDAINRFTTAEVKIDMTGMTNKIDSGMDLDGIIGQLTDDFSEALVTAAEGVHE
ncbi:MAG: phage tail protein [Oscillospiraceae bacterium]|nr:phage tail protein [Oscillospiraceae bacterium]